MYQKDPRGLLEVEISTIYMDFCFPKHPTNWLEVCICWRSCPRFLAQKSWFGIYGFSKLLLGIASIWVCILHIYIICYTVVLSQKKPKLEDNITGQNWNGSNKVIKHQKKHQNSCFGSQYERWYFEASSADLPSLIHVNAPVVVH